MNWKKYPDAKPSGEHILYACNEKSGTGYLVTYWGGCFRWANPDVREHPCLEITHFIELPKLPVQVLN